MTTLHTLGLHARRPQLDSAMRLRAEGVSPLTVARGMAMRSSPTSYG